MPPHVFALNAHAEYRCRHSGACCMAGWTIPIETRLQSMLGTEWLVPGPDGACPQYDRPSRLCRLQRDGGEAMLPGSCHHFPRRALIDRRGTFVALSNFCPTAATLLVDSPVPLSITQDPLAFPAARGYEGLEAVDDWPPLVRPRLLFDDESFTAWETFLVERIGQSEETVDRTLCTIARTAEQLREWTVDRGPLLDWTRGVIAQPSSASGNACARYLRFSGVDAFVRATATIPEGLERPIVPSQVADLDARFVAPAWDDVAPLALRYLGAKAFASWTAYQSRGVRTQVAELFLTASILRVECSRACATRQRPLERESLIDAVRASDLLLVHLADRDALMSWLGEVEHDADPPTDP